MIGKEIFKVVLNKNYKMGFDPYDKNNGKSSIGVVTEPKKQFGVRRIGKFLRVVDKGEVEEQFKNKSGDYYSNDKFIVSYNVNYNGFPHEVLIDLDNSFSNVRCIKVRRSLVSEQELDAFRSIEYALIKEGLSLIKNKEQKIEFFNKYAKPYNEKIKNENSNTK